MSLLYLLNVYLFLSEDDEEEKGDITERMDRKEWTMSIAHFGVDPSRRIERKIKKLKGVPSETSTRGKGYAT